LKFIFSLFYMTLWKGPMTAKTVFDEQQLGSVAMFAIDQSATRFFVLQVSRSFGWFVHPMMPGRVTAF
jgi:hypothetical protein